MEEKTSRQASKEIVLARMEKIIVLASLQKNTQEIAKEIGQDPRYTVKMINNLISRGVPITKKVSSHKPAQYGLSGELDEALAAVRDMKGHNEASATKELTEKQKARTTQGTEQPKYQPWWGIITRREYIKI